MQDIIKDFVSRGLADDALWPELAEAVKGRIAILEEQKSQNRTQKTKSYIDSDAEDAELSGCGESDIESSSFHKHSDLSSD